MTKSGRHKGSRRALNCGPRLTPLFRNPMDEFFVGATFLGLLAYALRVHDAGYPGALLTLAWLATAFSAIPVALVWYGVSTGYLTYLLLAAAWSWGLGMEFIRRRVDKVNGAAPR